MITSKTIGSSKSTICVKLFLCFVFSRQPMIYNSISDNPSKSLLSIGIWKIDLQLSADQYIAELERRFVYNVLENQ